MTSVTILMKTEVDLDGLVSLLISTVFAQSPLHKQNICLLSASGSPARGKSLVSTCLHRSLSWRMRVSLLLWSFYQPTTTTSTFSSSLLRLFLLFPALFSSPVGMGGNNDIYRTWWWLRHGTARHAMYTMP